MTKIRGGVEEKGSKKREVSKAAFQPHEHAPDTQQRGTFPTPKRSLCRSISRHTPRCLQHRFNMFMLKTLALAGAIVGAAAFAPLSRSMSAPDLRVPAPRIYNRGPAMVRSMPGDLITKLATPSGATETLEYTFDGSLQLRR